MLTRLLLAVLLTCSTLVTDAAPTIYEFEGYTGTYTGEASGTQTLPPFMFPIGARFTGHMTLDLEQQESPVITWRMHFQDPFEFYVTFEGSSELSVRRSGGQAFAIVSQGVVGTPANAYHGTASLGWSSYRQDQLPADIQTLDPAALVPNVWTLQIRTMSFQCAPNCAVQGTITGHVTALWKLGQKPVGFRERFDAGIVPDSWITSGDSWYVDGPGKSLRNSQGAGFASAVHTDAHLANNYTYLGTVYSELAGANNTLGIVLNYRDGANFDEVRLTPTGQASYNRVRNGARRTLQSAQYQGAPQKWIDFAIVRTGSRIEVSIDDHEELFVISGGAHGGHVGIFADNNRARFDKLVLVNDTFWGPVVHRFSESPPPGWTWQDTLGFWEVVDGYYYTSSNMHAAVSSGGHVVNRDYAVDASMFLEWSKSGNRGGLMYDYLDTSNYRAVLLSAGQRLADGSISPGTLELIEVRNGVRTTVLRVDSTAANAPRFLAKEWVPISVERAGELTRVIAPGTVIEANQPVVRGHKYIGVISSYNRVRFDDVVIATNGLSSDMW
jgi:hypothetical protein